MIVRTWTGRTTPADAAAYERLVTEEILPSIAAAAGDSLLIPAGTVHWYRNDGDDEGAFVCVVPEGDDAIELVE